MKKKFAGMLLGLVLAAAVPGLSAIAGGWTTNNSGYQVFQNDDGSIVTNSWIKANDNGRVIWYYATGNGTLRTDGWQKVGDDYYYFDGNGIMQTGWVDNNNYYCDVNNGAMRTGWKQLQLPDDVYSEDGSYGESYWFYFNTRTGEKFHSTDSYVTTKTIDGMVYGFDMNGCMVTGWAETESSSPEITGYMYFAEKTEGKFKLGQRVAGTWYATVGPENNGGGNGNDLSTGDVEWFYFKGNGHPAAGSSDVYDVQRINGKRFLFNSIGNPVYGIRRAVTSEDGTQHIYFCGTSRNDCSIKTGRVTLTQDDGERITCFFDNSGRGLTGIKNDGIYYEGKLQKADSNVGYSKVNFDGSVYVVNSSGNIMKNRKNNKDRDGVKWSTNADGTLASEEDGVLTEITLTAPEVTEETR